MNVLFLAWNYPPAMGGIEYVAKHLVAGLRAAGDDVKVVARHAPGQTDETDAVRPARPGLLRYLWFAFWKSRRLLRDFRADLIVCPGVVTAPVAWMLARGGRPPFVVLAHGSDVAHGGNLYRRVLCYFFRAAAGVAANSRSTVELMHKAGCRPRQLRVIHPGVRLEDFPRLDDAGRQALRARHGLDGRFVLLSVGRLIRRKGVLDFIENALPRLVAERPNVLLVVVGGDAADSLVHREGMLAQIQSAVARTRLEGHVRLMGSVDDRAVRELHGAADVHLLPALRMDNDVEGFGIVLLEASLAEVPVVATRAGGIPEAVAEGVSGLLADPGDWDGLVHVLLTLARDDDLRKRLGQAGRARAQAEFGWGTIAGQYREFFRDLLAGRDAPA